MSLPNEPDWALIKMGDGAETEVFTVICGISDVTISETANTNDRTRRDCEKPGEVPFRYTRTSSRQLDISGSGIANADETERLSEALGRIGSYRIETYRDNNTDAGELIGTYAGSFNLTSNNVNLAREGDSGGDISLASHGPWTYTAAPAG